MAIPGIGKILQDLDSRLLDHIGHDRTSLVDQLAMLAGFGTLLVNTDPVLSVARPIAPSLGLDAEPSPPVSQQVMP